MTKLEKKLIQLGYEKDNYVSNFNQYVKYIESHNIRITLNSDKDKVIDYYVYTHTGHLREKEKLIIDDRFDQLQNDLKELKEIDC